MTAATRQPPLAEGSRAVARGSRVHAAGAGEAPSEARGAEDPPAALGGPEESWHGLPCQSHRRPSPITPARSLLPFPDDPPQGHLLPFPLP